MTLVRLILITHQSIHLNNLLCKTFVFLILLRQQMLGIFCLLLALDAFIIIQHFTFYGVVIVCEDYSPCVWEIYQPYGLIVHCGNADNDGQ